MSQAIDPLPDKAEPLNCFTVELANGNFHGEGEKVVFWGGLGEKQMIDARNDEEEPIDFDVNDMIVDGNDVVLTNDYREEELVVLNDGGCAATSESIENIGERTNREQMICEENNKNEIMEYKINHDIVVDGNDVLITNVYTEEKLVAGNNGGGAATCEYVKNTGERTNKEEHMIVEENNEDGVIEMKINDIVIDGYKASVTIVDNENKFELVSIENRGEGTNEEEPNKEEHIVEGRNDEKVIVVEVNSVAGDRNEAVIAIVDKEENLELVNIAVDAATNVYVENSEEKTNEEKPISTPAENRGEKSIIDHSSTCNELNDITEDVTVQQREIRRKKLIRNNLVVEKVVTGINEAEVQASDGNEESSVSCKAGTPNEVKPQCLESNQVSGDACKEGESENLNSEEKVDGKSIIEQKPEARSAVKISGAQQTPKPLEQENNNEEVKKYKGRIICFKKSENRLVPEATQNVNAKVIDEPESSKKGNLSEKNDSMGMIFMCNSETKKDCYKYKVLGLPAGKKKVVSKIYKGMSLFLFDVDLKMLYGVYEAASPGSYNIEPRAFGSQFPSQVRFNVSEDCVPLAEERFKEVIKDNYYTKNKFDCQLTSEQVKNLCKLFLGTTKKSESIREGLRQRDAPTASSRVGKKRKWAADSIRMGAEAILSQKHMSKCQDEVMNRTHVVRGQEEMNHTHAVRGPNFQVEMGSSHVVRVGEEMSLAHVATGLEEMSRTRVIRGHDGMSRVHVVRGQDFQEDIGLSHVARVGEISRAHVVRRQVGMSLVHVVGGHDDMSSRHVVRGRDFQEDMGRSHVVRIEEGMSRSHIVRGHEEMSRVLVARRQENMGRAYFVRGQEDMGRASLVRDQEDSSRGLVVRGQEEINRAPVVIAQRHHRDHYLRPVASSSLYQPSRVEDSYSYATVPRADTYGRVVSAVDHRDQGILASRESRYHVESNLHDPSMTYRKPQVVYREVAYDTDGRREQYSSASEGRHAESDHRRPLSLHRKY